MKALAFRQGDVLIRPRSEKITVQSSNTDWAALRTIWDARLKTLQNTTAIDRDAARAAVAELYKVLEQPLPSIVWHNGSSLIRTLGVPIRGIPDMVLNGLWLKFPERRRIASQMGYDPITGTYRITANKRLLTHDFRLRGRSGIRPPWTRDLGNMISQFDLPAVALYEFAKASDCQIDSQRIRLGDAIKQVLDTTFGVILFDRACVILDRPSKIALNPGHVLSATSIDPLTLKTRNKLCPAYETHNGHIIYAVNGVVISANLLERAQRNQWSTIANIKQPRLRAAVIGYFGWDQFLDSVPNQSRTLLDESRFGELHEVVCNSQHYVLLRVTNSTAEPDGSFRKYVLPVDHDCRPLPNPLDPSALHGAPQAQTALNAVASTFGMTGGRYQAMLGAES
jgi:hypothetical protein